MKLLTKEEIKDNKSKEIARDIGRLQTVQEALKKSQSELDETEAKMEQVLANQRVRWIKEEEEHLNKINSLNSEIKGLQTKRESLLLPIDKEAEKAHTLFTAAEAALLDAKKARKEADDIRAKNEEEAEYLQNRIDELTDREADVADREQKVQIQEENNLIERNQLKSLSKELLDKLHGYESNRSNT